MSVQPITPNPDYRLAEHREMRAAARALRATLAQRRGRASGPEIAPFPAGAIASFTPSQERQVDYLAQTVQLAKWVNAAREDVIALCGASVATVDEDLAPYHLHPILRDRINALIEQVNRLEGGLGRIKVIVPLITGASQQKG